MNLSQKQLEIIGKQGWNDVVVSNLALQFTNFLTQIADAENDAKETQEREKLTDKFWKAIEEDSSQALGEAVLFLLEKFPSDKLKEVVDEWVGNSVQNMNELRDIADYVFSGLFDFGETSVEDSDGWEFNSGTPNRCFCNVYLLANTYSKATTKVCFTIVVDDKNVTAQLGDMTPQTFARSKKWP